MVYYTPPDGFMYELINLYSDRNRPDRNRHVQYLNSHHSITFFKKNRKETTMSQHSTMNQPQSNLDFKLMSLAFRFRDFFLPRINILKEVGIKPGFHILDYGCGPGSYVTAASELVGESGKVYALDTHPLAVQTVQNIASKNQLTNVETIHSDCKTGLSDSSIDAVLLYDILHYLDNLGEVLEELHGVLKADGILSVSDHHMREDEIVSRVTNSKLFALSGKGKRTYSFLKEK